MRRAIDKAMFWVKLVVLPPMFFLAFGGVIYSAVRISVGTPMDKLTGFGLLMLSFVTLVGGVRVARG